MSVLSAPEPVEVVLLTGSGEPYCPCQGTPHPEGDRVYLAPELSMAGGMAAQGAIADAGGFTGADPIRLQELLAEVWIRHGVVGWTFLDDDGDPIPPTPANIVRALPYGKGGRQVAEKADDLYNEAILAPLVERVSELSKLGRKVAGTSPTRGRRNGTHRPPGPSSRGRSADSRR